MRCVTALLILAFAAVASPADAQQDASRQAALAYYAKHYPAYYQRYYGGLAPQAPRPAPPTLPSPAPTAAPVVAPVVDGPDTAPPPLEADPEAGPRTLGGHTFHYPRLVDSPFIATNLYAGTSVEMYRQQEVVSTVQGSDGTPKELTYDRNLMLLRLRYGVGFALGDHVGLGLDSDYLAEVGANDKSLLLRGGQTGFDFRPHLKIRLYRDDDGDQIALRGYATFSHGIRAVPQGMLNALADRLDDIAADPQRAACLAAGDLDCALGDEGLGGLGAVTRKRHGGGGALSWAHAFNSTAAFQAAAGAEVASATLSADWAGDVGATQILGYAGIAPSLNFAPSFPVGLTLGYRFELARSAFAPNETVGIESGASATAKNHRFTGGVYYTGRRDFMVGWNAGVALLEDAESSVLEATSSPDSTTTVDTEQPGAMLISANFEMRYFF